MGQGINTLSLELDDKEALALAQFVKRLTWSDLRGCAVDQGVSLDIENYCTVSLFFEQTYL
ncbi:hypothetical protein JYK47_004423 [Salmonella enterica]|nr:hypothetical protein [Salmonella enterica]EHB1479202.1 hypothetical protein [Salmonella enterica]EIR8635485.1 hypothetical protein [Salmonella enterica]